MSFFGNIKGVLDSIQFPLYGTSNDDYVHVSKAHGGLAGLLGLYDVNVNGHHQLMTKYELEHTDFELGSGDDVFVADSDVDANLTVHGGSGDDRITGGGGRDYLDGGSGDDYLNGGPGADTYSPGSGDNTVKY